MILKLSLESFMFAAICGYFNFNFQYQFIIQQWKFVLCTCKLVYIIILTDKRELCKVINIQWKNKELNDSNRFLYNLKYLIDMK